MNLACLFVCLFVSNKRQNGWTDRAQIFCGTSRDPREGSWMIKISNICLHQNSIFIKFLKASIHKIPLVLAFPKCGLPFFAFNITGDKKNLVQISKIFVDHILNLSGLHECCNNHAWESTTGWARFWNFEIRSNLWNFSKTILQKQKSILLGILRHVIKYIFHKNQNMPLKWGLIFKKSLV